MITDSKGNLIYSGSSMSYDLEMTKKSVETILRDLNFETLHPGHGLPITTGASEKIRALVAGRK